MELRNLQYFAVTAEELHFGRAARRLYVTQPGLSQGIKALERKIGVPLFDRTHGSVTLTPAGEALLPDVLQLLLKADDVRRLAEHLAVTRAEGLRLSHPLSAGVGVPCTLAASFRRAYPDIDVQTLSGTTRLNVERVRSREVDLGFVYPPFELTTDLSCLVLAREQIVVAAPAGHPLVRQPAVHQVDLQEYPLVFFASRSGGLWKSVLDAVYGVDLQPRIVRVEPDEPHMLTAVADHAGIGLLTARTATILNVPGVTVRPFVEKVTVPLGVVWRRDNANPALGTYLELANDTRDAATLDRSGATPIRESA